MRGAIDAEVNAAVSNRQTFRLKEHHEVKPVTTLEAILLSAFDVLVLVTERMVGAVPRSEF